MNTKQIWSFVRPIAVVAVGAYLAILADRQIEKWKLKKTASKS